MDKLNKFYVILLILLLLIVIYVFMNKNVNEFFYGYTCDNTSGCIDGDEFDTRAACDTKCKFEYKDNRCVKSNSGEYNTKYKCDNRYTCSNTQGRCVYGPNNIINSHASLTECREKCKFIKVDNTSCESNPEGTFDSKTACENRYTCINGSCRQRAGERDGTYHNERFCNDNCNIGDYPDNALRMHFVFDRNIDVTGLTKQYFKENLKRIVVGTETVIRANSILGIKIDQEKATVIFDNITTDILTQIYTDIDISRSITITTDEDVRYNLIQIEFIGQPTPIQTAPILSTSNNRSTNILLLKIKNTRNAYSLNVIDYSILDLDLDITRRNESLRRIQKEATTKKITISLPTLVYINRHPTANDFYYETHPDLNNFIRIKNITDDYLEKIRLQGYLDYDMIKSIYGENTNVRIAIIGNRDTRLFDYDNEFFLLLYKNSSGQLKYKQINVDLDIMKLVKPAEQKNINYINPKLDTMFDLDMDTYSTFISNLEQLDNVKIKTEPGVSKDFKPMLFDNYYPGLRFEFNLSVRNNNETTDILSYTEDSQPSLNELRCDFIPTGESLFECKQMCTDEKETNNCSESNCNDKCNHCGTLECKWNMIDYNRNKTLKPTDARIKCFSGNKSIKVTWLKPLSMFPVDKYYITLSNSNTNSLHVYMYESSAEINEYVINSLENSELYDVNLVCKNKFGVSDISNTESVIPDKSKHFDNISEIKHSDYEDTIEKYYNNNYEDLGLSAPINYRQQVSLYEQELVKNDLKDILVDALVHDNNIKQYTLNIF